MEFDIFIITQITYVIVTFKSTIPTCSRAHIAHVQVLNAFVYDGVLFVSKHLNRNYHDNTAYRGRRLTLPRCQNVDG